MRIALDISTEEVERLYNDYWRLKGLHQLHRYYETEIKKDLLSFLKLYAKVRRLGISDENVLQALSRINKLPLLKMAYKINERENKYLMKKKISLFLNYLI